MKKYKVGLIGFGFIGKVHEFGFRNIPLYYNNDEFSAQVVKVCTARPETAAKAAALTGAEGVTDFRAITEDPEIDIVDIASPNDCHFAELASAIAHNKHIYCDKPLTDNAEEALKIAAMLPEYKGIAQMTLMYRFYPAVLRAKELIDEGRIGRILEIHASFLHSGSVSPDTPYKWKLGAGTTADLGSHIFDLLQFLAGPVSALTAHTFIAHPERKDFYDPEKMVKITADDSMHCLVRLANGGVGTVSASKVATGTEDEVSFTIHGTNGALRMEPMNLQQLFFYDNTAADAPHGGMKGWTAIDCGARFGGNAAFPAPKAVMGWMRGHVHCLHNFLEAVYYGKMPTPSLEDGIQLQILLDKVKESAHTGHWVTL